MRAVGQRYLIRVLIGGIHWILHRNRDLGILPLRTGDPLPHSSAVDPVKGVPVVGSEMSGPNNKSADGRLSFLRRNDGEDKEGSLAQRHDPLADKIVGSLCAPCRRQHKKKD